MLDGYCPKDVIDDSAPYKYRKFLIQKKHCALN